MSDAPKKRPWLQFHLSTAIVLMFVAGGLLWLTLQYYVVFTDESMNGTFSGSFLAGFWVMLGLECLAILYWTCRFCEWLIRRKERRQ